MVRVTLTCGMYLFYCSMNSYTLLSYLQVVEEWLGLLRRRHREDPGCTIAVHCVAGLGRAPVLVAIALIELGQRYEDAVELIRQSVDPSVMFMKFDVFPEVLYICLGR